MNKRLPLLIVLLGFGLIGCATPTNLALKGQYVSQIDSEGTRIFITRNTGLRDSANAQTISMDGVNYFRIKNQETVVFDEPKLGTRTICYILQDAFLTLDNCIDVEVTKGEKLFFEAKWKSAMSPTIVFVKQTKEEFLSNN